MPAPPPFAIDKLDGAVGVPDDDRDPFVVAVDSDCAGALLQENVVLTSRGCAAGRAVVADTDVALIVLDDRTGIVPRPVRKRAVAQGDHLRTVAYSRGTKVLREHVEVIEVARTEFVLAEDAGGVAVDESTGEIVGVALRQDGDLRSVYARLDPYPALIDEASRLAKERVPQQGDEPIVLDDAPAPLKPEKAKPPSDVGEICQLPADCATGVCVRDEDRHYCSRTCGGRDRCPTGFRCTADASGTKACANAP